jgi:hypothetical protein
MSPRAAACAQYELSAKAGTDWSAYSTPDCRTILCGSILCISPQERVCTLLSRTPTTVAVGSRSKRKTMCCVHESMFTVRLAAEALDLAFYRCNRAL